jgi:hypothetical protein
MQSLPKSGATEGENIMSDWNVILDEAEWLARQFRQRGVDLSEAEKAGDYYTHKGCNEKTMTEYLELMATRPPLRSRRSLRHFQNLHEVWQSWRTNLQGKDKARAWGWGVRRAKSPR